MLLVLMILATFRIARFIAQDTFPPMKWLRAKLTTETRVQDVNTATGWVTRVLHVKREGWAEGIECPHCVGVYVAFAVTLITAQIVDIQAPWLVAIAVAGGQSFLASWIED